MAEDRPPLTIAGMVAFELGLGLAALVLGYLLQSDPLQTIPRGPDAVATNLIAAAWGLAAAAPLLVAMLTMTRLDLRWMAPVKRALDEHLLPLLAASDPAGRMALALAAGIGEELLFRGLVQQAVGGWAGPLAGLLLSAALFGACHWINRAYAILAAAIGIHLGLLFLWTGNLVAPATAHAFYDFAAIEYLLRGFRQQRQADATEGSGESNEDA